MPMTAAEARAALAHDPHRPRYHFTAPHNWLNDPNGFYNADGVYQLFYQYNPNGAQWGDIHWGHATSTDLVTWTDLPIALAPTPGGPDEGGCWSGAAVVHEGVPTLLYTGVRNGDQRPCLAVSHDNWVTWEKYADNPVIATPPEGVGSQDFRDHVIWREGDDWYQLIGAGFAGIGGATLLYRSRDLRTWDYLHPLYHRPHTELEPVPTGTMWECPDFFPLGDKHVLVISVWSEDDTGYTAYMVGDYRDHRFTPDSFHVLDYGRNRFFAPQSLKDESGRRVMMGWVREDRRPAAQIRAGWSGAMSLPRVLALRPDGRLSLTPHPHLQHLRGDHFRLTDVDVTDTLPLSVAGDTLELLVEWDISDAAQVGLKFRASPDGEEETLLTYDRATGDLVLDRTRTTLDPEAHRYEQRAPLHLAEGETLKLHIFLDRSVVEIFANDYIALTARVYPTRADSVGLALVASGGAARVVSVDVWEVAGV